MAKPTPREQIRKKYPELMDHKIVKIERIEEGKARLFTFELGEQRRIDWSDEDQQTSDSKSK